MPRRPIQAAVGSASAYQRHARLLPPAAATAKKPGKPPRSVDHTAGSEQPKSTEAAVLFGSRVQFELERSSPVRVARRPRIFIVRPTKILQFTWARYAWEEHELSPPEPCMQLAGGLLCLTMPAVQSAHRCRAVHASQPCSSPVTPGGRAVTSPLPHPPP